MAEITIIIVSYNCRHYLQECLRSLRNDTSPAARRVIVVDNASTDGSPAMVAREFPDFDVIQAGANVGFAAANNIALRQTRSPFVLLLNPDTVVARGAIDRLAEFLRTNRKAWAVGPFIRNSDGSPQRTGVRFPSFRNILWETLFLDRLFPMSPVFGAHRELYKDPTVGRQVDYVQGSCLMVRWPEVGRNVGELDERFFMYFEETDWCARMKERGAEVWIEPGAEIVHYGGGETGHFDEVRLTHYHESLLRFMAKHAGHTPQLPVRMVLMLRAWLRILVWLGFLLVRPRSTNRALSSLKGYWRVMGLLLTYRPGAAS